MFGARNGASIMLGFAQIVDHVDWRNARSVASADATRRNAPSRGVDVGTALRYDMLRVMTRGRGGEADYETMEVCMRGGT